MLSTIAILFGLAASSPTPATSPVILVPREYSTEFAPSRNAASIRSGIHDCPHCDLRNEDLSNSSASGGKLEGAIFDGANVELMNLLSADLKGASFHNADLAGTNLARANLDNVDFAGAVLEFTSFKGTDLTHAKGLTQSQLDRACGDADTIAPAGMHVPSCH
jgi:uncharacterized protein YjbI with pentapeptide repeats